MSDPVLDLGASAGGADRRTAWMIWLSKHLLRQDLTAEDRVAILATMLGREISTFPKERWGDLCGLVGDMMGAACCGAAQARAAATLALATPAGHG